MSEEATVIADWRKEKRGHGCDLCLRDYSAFPPMTYDEALDFGWRGFTMGIACPACEIGILEERAEKAEMALKALWHKIRMALGKGPR